MRAVIQRVSEARVEVDGEVLGQINEGLMILLGVHGRSGSRSALSGRENCPSADF